MSIQLHVIRVKYKIQEAIMQEFSKNLKTSLKAKKMSQQKLANHLGTTQQTVSRWLIGINEPDLTTLVEICKYLDETPNDLLGYEEIKIKEKKIKK